PENGEPNGDPIRGQKPSQRVTWHPKALAGPEVTKRQAQRGISAFGGAKKWWTGGELNSRHRDFQRVARAIGHHWSFWLAVPALEGPPGHRGIADGRPWWPEVLTHL